jgi:hypothetical protein
MRRRDFLAGVGAALVPGAAYAQQAKRLGILMGIANDAEGQLRISALLEALRGLGWQDGSDIALDVRWAGGQHGARPRARGGTGGLAAIGSCLQQLSCRHRTPRRDEGHSHRVRAGQ